MNKTETQEYREKFINIDPHDLHTEWLEFPVIYSRACDALTDNERMKDAAQIDVERTKAELWLDVKQKFKEYGFEKSPTKDDIDATIEKDKEYIRAKNHLATQNQYLQEAKNFLRVLDIKKRALEKLVELYGLNYFSSPQVKEVQAGKKSTDFFYEKCEEKQRENLNKKEEPKQEIESEESETPKRIRRTLRARKD